jgi:hypothetical protein
MQVMVTIGRYELFTQRAECVKGVSEWNEFLTQEFDYPIDDSMVRQHVLITHIYFHMLPVVSVVLMPGNVC